MSDEDNAVVLCADSWSIQKDRLLTPSTGCFSELEVSLLGNADKDDITSQHSDILAMCCKVTSSLLIFAVLDLRVCGCRP